MTLIERLRKKWFYVVLFLFVALDVRATEVTLLSWNVAGNGQTDWSTNSVQVQAIARILQHLQPDVIALQEIPFRESHEMTNFVAAYLEGFHLARFSGTDGIMRSVILSRFPIVREQKWLDGVLLDEFGYDGRFTRDLFEAEIAVPDWSMPLHVFTTHLKAGFDAESVGRRGAEALAISNFFVNTFPLSGSSEMFVLTGDLNEDHEVHDEIGAGVLGVLTNEVVGLELLTPVDPMTGDHRTFSVRASLSSRLDYVLPSDMLGATIDAHQLFNTRTRGVSTPELGTFDSSVASDHLPVIVRFRNPVDDLIRMESIDVSREFVTLKWTAEPGVIYGVEASEDLVTWRSVDSEISSGGRQATLHEAVKEPNRFYRVRRENGATTDRTGGAADAR